MKPSILWSLAAIVCASLVLHGVEADAQSTTNGNIAGEILAFAIDSADPRALRELHRAGWLEATGQLLSTQDFPAARAMIGLAWTAENVPPDRFALPDLRYLSARPGSMDRVTRELLGGDLVTGGRTFGPRDSSWHLLYCVYVGTDVSELDSQTGRLKRSSR